MKQTRWELSRHFDGLFPLVTYKFFFLLFLYVNFFVSGFNCGIYLDTNIEYHLQSLYWSSVFFLGHQLQRSPQSRYDTVLLSS